MRQAYLSPLALEGRALPGDAFVERDVDAVHRAFADPGLAAHAMRSPPFKHWSGAGEVIIDLIGQACVETVSGGIFSPGFTGHFGTM